MAIGLLFSCTTDIESAEEVLARASSSSAVQGVSSGGSSQSGLAFCQFPDNTCRQYSEKACLVFGQVVESCPETGNSSSSVVYPSSSAQPGSSSSSLPSGSVSCEVSGICAEVSGELCAVLGGTTVQSCHESSSSFAIPSSSSIMPSSNSVVPSSSSALPSSSSTAPSSSSATLPSSPSEGSCIGFVEGTEREHFGKMKKQFCDERDGYKYVYVEIGTQTWLAENLNYVAEDSKCNDCSTYGRLYNWATAMDLESGCNSNECSRQIQTKHKGICPAGWHLPSEAEWNVLVKLASDAGRLKVASEWGGNDRSTDTYGFSALPNSSRRNEGYWWTATEKYAGVGYALRMNDASGYLGGDYYNKSDLYSIRCVQDQSFSSATSSSSSSGGGSSCSYNEGTMCLWNGGGDCWKVESSSEKQQCAKDAWLFKGGEEGAATLCKGGTFISGCGKNNNPPTSVSCPDKNGSCPK